MGVDSFARNAQDHWGQETTGVVQEFSYETSRKERPIEREHTTGLAE
jgi:hypothetical protein